MAGPFYRTIFKSEKNIRFRLVIVKCRKIPVLKDYAPLLIIDEEIEE